MMQMNKLSQQYLCGDVLERVQFTAILWWGWTGR